VGLCARVAPSIDVPPPTAVELCVLGLAVVAALVWPWRRGALALVAAAGICFAVEAWLAVGVPARRDGAVVTFLDVGQGDGAVIEAPHGETWLVDAGGRLFDATGGAGNDPGEQATLRFLVARRVRRLDLVVVSHPHPDHYGGLVAVAAHLPIAELWISGDDPRDAPWTPPLPHLPPHRTRPVPAPPATPLLPHAPPRACPWAAPHPA